MKILIANRGEIAIRLIRACHEMGLKVVAVYTDLDAYSLHVRLADEAVPLGEKAGYLQIEKIIKAARKSKVDAVHPGYGFLSENAAFAKAVEEAGLIFIGPRPETIALLGDKLASRRAAIDAGLPVLPGSQDALPREVPFALAESVKYPVLVKAAAGGGGKGIRLARSAKELQEVVNAARREAEASFGDGTVFLESMVQQARHIEVQILGDGQGNVLCLGERECSIQRRRQKLIEESPAPDLPEELRSQLYDAAFRLGKALNYRSLGTVVFLVDPDHQHHFIEVNPRIQVEHPVTEWVTGLDLVREQIALALSGRLPHQQAHITLQGSAIEARVLAEDSEAGFLPSSGTITYVKEPGGPGIRVDSELYQGMAISAAYDSLLAKVIAWGENRTSAIQRLRRALAEFQIGGIKTDLEFLLKIIESPPFIAGEVTTTYLDDFQPPITVRDDSLEEELALAAAMYVHKQHANNINKKIPASLWQRTAWREQMPGKE
jgi:acetyl-CoA carboxylase biotin carboxylase subunit